MPASLVAHTGMDAMTHAFEAYVSTARNEITDALAMKSIEMMYEHLLKSYKGNMQSREKNAHCTVYGWYVILKRYSRYSS